MINQCHIGDCRETMRRLISAGVKVQMCVTSPPYWGLRDYGTATWDGGDAACDHVKTTLVGTASTLRNDGRKHQGPYEGEKAFTESVTPYRDRCGKCGARRIDAQLGLESTPAEYVAKMVEVFRLVRDMLADDGVLFLNLGDSYATGAGRAYSPGGGAQGDTYRAMGGQVPDSKNPNSGIPVYQPNRMPIAGLKPKDLIGIPWRVAFALQADGWYLRSDIIWHKPNPMPESVTDRPTKSHEYLFLLAKSARYYYDAHAIAEPTTSEGGDTVGSLAYSIGSGRNDGNGTSSALRLARDTRNKRTVWTVATSPYAEAHFATFPPALVEPCILAGSRPGDVVLDPFFGSGTVGQVAERLGRRWLGCELSEEYGKLAARRTAQMGMTL